MDPNPDKEGADRSGGLQMKDGGSMDMGIQGDKSSGVSKEFKKGVDPTHVAIIAAGTLENTAMLLGGNKDGFQNRWMVIPMCSRESKLRESHESC